MEHSQIISLTCNYLEGIQKFEEIGGETTPVRFAVQIDNEQYRLFSYFTVGNDLSLAAQSYFKSTHHYDNRIDVPPEKLEVKTFSISEKKRETVPYVVNKSTFHRSGILNTKDSSGLRPSEDRDIKSIAFDEIKDAIRLFYFYPPYYNNYPIITERNDKHHNILCFNGEIKKCQS